jgi:hypothetical protein
MGISSQNTLLHNLLTVQPIFTSSIPVDSAQRVEEQVQNFTAGCNQAIKKNPQTIF